MCGLYDCFHNEHFEATWWCQRMHRSRTRESWGGVQFLMSEVPLYNEQFEATAVVPEDARIEALGLVKTLTEILYIHVLHV